MGAGGQSPLQTTVWFGLAWAGRYRSRAGGAPRGRRKGAGGQSPLQTTVWFGLAGAGCCLGSATHPAPRSVTRMAR